MRTKEKDKIIHLYYHRNEFLTDTKDVAGAFPYYNKLINELHDKSVKLYNLYLNEHRSVKDSTRIKNYAKILAIEHVLKLKRGVVLHAIETGNKSLQRASNYVYSDFFRPSEEIRIARFHQVVNAAKRIKHPEHFGLSKEVIAEAEKSVKEYCVFSASPALRKKERARQAKQCRKMLSEINFILREKMMPFLENIQDQFPHSLDVWKGFLKPVKIGRPPEKPVRKRRTSEAKNKQEEVNSNEVQKELIAIPQNTY